MTKFAVHFQIVMDCTQYFEGGTMYEVYDNVTNNGELQLIPPDMIDEVTYTDYKVWSVNKLNEDGATIDWIGTEREK